MSDEMLGLFMFAAIGVMSFLGGIGSGVVATLILLRNRLVPPRRLSPAERLVAEARDPVPRHHDCFEWDDARAAAAYRTRSARNGD